MFEFTHRTPIEKELAALARQEQRLDQAAIRADSGSWKDALKAKVPPKTMTALEAAFGKGFALIFEKGTGVIEKTYNAGDLRRSHDVADYAARVTGKRRDLRNVSRAARAANFGNLVLTTAEGVGLGALGIGMPDIVVFLGMLLKGIYETALRYGFSYDTPEDRLLILKMMEAALSKGDDRIRCSRQVDELLQYSSLTEPEELREQIRITAGAFAADMLILKFIQGMPLVGILGGAGNPVYYNKVLRYVELKYRKKYLLGLAGRKG